MDFPLYDFPLLGNRWLIALVAVLHVVVNHGAAIGGSLLVVMAERRGLRTGDARWDTVAYRLTFFFFLLTTTIGALSGVGIWFTTMVSQPAGLSALLHIFFWAWFAEWLVFIAEVGMVMAYFLSWHHFANRETHLRLGYAYVIASFLTMVIVTGILGAMLTPGAWLSDHRFWSAFFNPTYGPQLVLRAGLALALAAALGLLISRWLVEPVMRPPFQQLCARFFLAAAPLIAVGGAWYLAVLPDHFAVVFPTALLTGRFAAWATQAAWVAGVAVVLLAALGGWGWRSPRAWPWPVAALIFLSLVAALGTFERVREFVRKPYLIPGYIYANGILVADVPRLNREGMLPNARWAGVTQVDPRKPAIAGKALYHLECAACHTLDGPNGLKAATAGQSAQALGSFIAYQHLAKPFMPPFVGTPAEREALAAYLESLNAPGKPEASP